jgi:hypothetical protein
MSHFCWEFDKLYYWTSVSQWYRFSPFFGDICFYHKSSISFLLSRLLVHHVYVSLVCVSWRTKFCVLAFDAPRLFVSFKLLCDVYCIHLLSYVSSPWLYICTYSSICYACLCVFNISFMTFIIQTCEIDWLKLQLSERNYCA